jgi:Tfp pilus assembly protein PilX
VNARPNERGVALVVSLLVVHVIALIAVAIAVSTRGGERGQPRLRR